MSGLATADLRHLAALRAVSEEGSFGRAARRLGFSQAAVSQQIAALERAVGVPVFDRPGGPRPVRLTPAGRLVLRHAEAVLDRIAEADAELAQLLAGSGGRLAVGTFQSVAVRLLPGLVAQLKAESPDLDIHVVQTDDTARLTAALVDGALDVSFVETHVDHPDIVVDPVLRDPFVLVVPRTDAIVAGLGPDEPYPLDALADRPAVGHEDMCAAVAHMEDGLAREGIVPRYVFRTEDNGALQAMVRAGIGWALMPLLSVDESDPGVAVRLTDPPLPMRDVLVARRTGVHAVPAAERLAKLAVAAGGGVELATSTLGELARSA